jgi:hypothetical protein
MPTADPGRLARVTTEVAKLLLMASGTSANGVGQSGDRRRRLDCRECNTYYSNVIGGYFPDTYVSMYCWVDNPNAWSYGTDRWVLVGGVGFNPYSGRITWIEGFVSANKLWNQSRVGHC